MATAGTHSCIRLASLWTHGESNPELVHAMDACYRYTMSPVTLNSDIVPKKPKNALLNGSIAFRHFWLYIYERFKLRFVLLAEPPVVGCIESRFPLGADTLCFRQWERGRPEISSDGPTSTEWGEYKKERRLTSSPTSGRWGRGYGALSRPSYPPPSAIQIASNGYFCI